MNFVGSADNKAIDKQVKCEVPSGTNSEYALKLVSVMKLFFPNVEEFVNPEWFH